MMPAHRELIDQIHVSLAVLRRAVDTTPADRFTRVPAPGEWSALETLTHVRDVIVHVYGLRLRRMFYEDDPLFADFDEEGYRAAMLERGETPASLMAVIVGEHEQLARLLELVPDQEWSRSGRHPVYGVMSIEFLARRIGEHAIEHAAQITEARGT
jgi:hypothetical protein